MGWRSSRFFVGVLTAGVAAALMIADATRAQIGNEGPSLGAGDEAIDIGAGIIRHKLNGVASAATPMGRGLSRLPLTTPQEMPYATQAVSPPVAGRPGSSVDPAMSSQSYGTSSQGWPYSHQRVAVYGNPGPSTYSFQTPVTSRPYRFTGKLWMRFGSSWFVCTASLIKKGLLVTAAHCIHNYGNGASGWADEVRWYPANYASYGGPWGYYSSQDLLIPTTYYNGTDTCTVVGIVCSNDLAIVVLVPRNGVHAGAAMGGWYRYGWNGYSFQQSSAGFGGHTIAEITQLGYPVAWDSGYQMQRNNSFGKYVTGTGTNGQVMKNIQLGSPLSGGSSGGPWMVNFGTLPVLTDSSNASYGADPFRRVVVGTTSWGYTDKNINVQGASWFGQNFEYPESNYGGYGAGNIGALVQAACDDYAEHC